MRWLSKNLFAAFIFLLLLRPVMLQAQIRYFGPTSNFNNANELVTDVAGRPIYLKVEYRIEGSPYLPTEYSYAEIVLKDGRRYNEINSRVNFYDNTLVMKKDDGSEQVIVSNVSRVIYRNIMIGGVSRNYLFGKGFAPIDDRDTATFYEILDSGRLKLLKSYAVNYQDQRPYGEASITRRFILKDAYFLSLPNGGMVRLGKGRDAFLAALPDKKNEVTTYFDQKKNKARNEDDWRELVTFYNSLE